MAQCSTRSGFIAFSMGKYHVIMKFHLRFLYCVAHQFGPQLQLTYYPHVWLCPSSLELWMMSLSCHSVSSKRTTRNPKTMNLRFSGPSCVHTLIKLIQPYRRHIYGSSSLLDMIFTKEVTAVFFCIAQVSRPHTPSFINFPVLTINSFASTACSESFGSQLDRIVF